MRWWWNITIINYCKVISDKLLNYINILMQYYIKIILMQYCYCFRYWRYFPSFLQVIQCLFSYSITTLWNNWPFYKLSLQTTCMSDGRHMTLSISFSYYGELFVRIGIWTYIGALKLKQIKKYGNHFNKILIMQIHNIV